MAYTGGISPSALTLADHAEQSNDVGIQAITACLLDGGSVLDDLPLDTNPSLKVRVGRMQGSDLPATGWGKINQGPLPVKTTSSTAEEQAAMIREIIQIDRKLLEQPNWVGNPFDTQITGIMAAHRYDMNDAFFNNDVALGNPDAWAGLIPRVKNPITYGLPLNPDGVTTPLYISGAGLNLKTNMTAATGNDFFEVIAQAFAMLGSSDGSGCVAYTNWLTKERWARAYRMQSGGGGFSITQDNFGRMVEKYRQCTVRDIGFAKNQVTGLISYTLDSNGNEVGVQNSNTTRIVICRYGGNYLKGWQDGPLKPEYLGRSVETGVFENVLIDWACGLYYANNHAFVVIDLIPIK